MAYKFNPFTGTLDYYESGSGGGAATFIEVANYTALPAAGTAPGQTYIVLASQGTPYIGGLWGGTYYGKGYYYDTGSAYIYTEVPYQATQAEVNTGTNTDKFVTPNTFTNASKWNTKQPTSPFNISAPITHTGTTDETIVYNTSPNLVGIILADDYFQFETTMNATNSVSQKTLSFYISDSPTSLLNETLIGAASVGTGWGANPAVRVARFLKMKGTLSTNTYLNNSVTSMNINNFYAQSSSPINTAGTINFSATAKYFVVTLKLADAAAIVEILEGHSHISRP